jgi:hypothetical protein
LKPQVARPSPRRSPRNSTPASPASHISISSSPASSTTLARRGEFSATESEDCNSSTATTPKRSGYGEKRRLRYHKVNGKKVQNPDGKYAASWEERYHKKRHFHHFSDDNDDAPTI